MLNETAENRLRRKLAQRDSRIAGLTRQIELLSAALATAHLENNPRNISKSVQDALCNVRLIPVLGVGKSAKILEIKTTDAK